MHIRVGVVPMLVAAALLAPAAASAQWNTALTDTLAGTPASERSTRFSVDVDVNDAPHAIWTVGTRIFYSRRDPGGWIPPIELGAGDASYALHAVAVIPGTSTPCVLYSRRPFALPSGELQLARWNGFGFDVQALTADSVEKATPALAMDAAGGYHVITVVRSSAAWRLRYLTNAGGTAMDTILTLGDLGIFGSGASPAIDLEAGGIAHVVYRGVTGDYHVHHAQNDAPGSASWTWETLLSPNAFDTSADVELDADGAVHVVASGADCDVCITRAYAFQRPAGGPWGRPVPIVHGDPQRGLGGPSLALDAGGKPHAVLSEVNGSFYTGRLHHAGSRTGWVSSLVVGDDHGTPSLAADSRWRLHLVCSTGPNTGVRNVLYLQSQALTASVEGAALPVEPGLLASPNPFRGETWIHLAERPSGAAGPTAGEVAVVFDLAGRAVRHLEPSPLTGGHAGYRWDGRSESGHDLPAGVYRVAIRGADDRNGPRAIPIVKLR